MTTALIIVGAVAYTLIAVVAFGFFWMLESGADSRRVPTLRTLACAGLAAIWPVVLVGCIGFVVIQTIARGGQ